MTTIREAAEARARAEGFNEARMLLKALSDAGLSTGAVALALGAQWEELDDAARVAEREAREVVEHRAETRGSRAKEAPPAEPPGTLA